jgi:hypothetical protein
MVKVLRLVKIVQVFHGLDTLYLMSTAMSGCGWALLWGVCALVFIMTFLSIVCTSLFRSYLYDVEGNLSEEDKMTLFSYFGTFTLSFLSLFELSIANWIPICRFLMNTLHESFMLVALAVKLIVGVAAIGVINSIFMQETFKVAHTDNDMMVKTKVRAANEHKRKMEVLFRLADENRDGRLERDEFLEVLRDPTIKTWLASMDLAVDDQETLFDLLSGDDGAISLEELIGGISQLKGPARSIDLRKLMRAIEAPREP